MKIHIEYDHITHLWNLTSTSITLAFDKDNLKYEAAGRRKQNTLGCSVVSSTSHVAQPVRYRLLGIHQHLDQVPEIVGVK